jgi:uncharacterized oxidoreductase
MNTTGNTIFITGGGSGIGRGLAEAFHKLGNKVIIGGRRESVLAATAAANPGMEFVVFDAASQESITAGTTELTRRFPTLNVVINNAGVQWQHNFATQVMLDESGVDAEIDTNILGVMRVSAAFLPHLKQQPSATIVNLTSGLAFTPMAAYPVYCATKAFVHSFTLSLRHQLRETPVRVIELAPPWVATDLAAAQPEQADHGDMKPMPLADFIAEAMAALATEDEELLIANARFLHDSAVAPQSGKVFAMINGAH